ncbi:MAG: RNA-binding protein [Myxococcales bacterium]|nr:RNA-binding protein [Myxococcales bacterium]MCB9647611.1 RNA-binding protein [Deltaproteobacteria bacterium]
MANRNLFSSKFSKLPKTDARNEAGGAAYNLTPEQALAQYAVTGTFNGTFYASAETQLATLQGLGLQVSPEFLAKTAIYARQRGHMKDMPAYLCALLSVRDTELLGRAFPRVVDNGKMVRNFVQMIRSGAVGRRSLGSAPKRLVRAWIDGQADEQLFRQAVGSAPSLADVIKMVHPKPQTPARSALYGYLLGKGGDTALLPPLVQAFEAYKARKTGAPPAVPFQMLTGLELDRDGWKGIAEHASWQVTRQALNTFVRQGVFEDKKLAKLIAARLADPQEVKKARAFPYQLMSAYLATGNGVPKDVRDALQDAMEVALQNVPRFAGQVAVCVDVSGSMQSPVTGYRSGATSKVRCVDVAALVAAAVVRKNPNAMVLPFDTEVRRVDINGRDSVMTNAQRLAMMGGGTNCSVALQELNRTKARVDLVVFVSDNESWVDMTSGRGTATLQQWTQLKRRNPDAKLVNIDIQPYRTTQTAGAEDILNVGGFSDAVFDVVADFASARNDADRWGNTIREIEL